MTFARRTLLGFGLSLLAPLVRPFAARADMEGPNSMDAATEAALKTALASSERSPADRARDRYRHPLETLKFFGLRRGMTVMEVWPGGGWWTEFLAPVVAQSGSYIAAHEDTSGGEGGSVSQLKEWTAKQPGLAGKIAFDPFFSGKLDGVKPGTVDLVMTFRNIHNWMAQGDAKTMFDAMYAALKPGGHLGVEEHRGPAGKQQDPEAKSGYVGEDFAVNLIQSSGFKLAAKSEINANPKDTKDYPKGVWTLPPTYAEGDTDHAKYAAIGESDRFTLLFQKPAS